MHTFNDSDIDKRNGDMFHKKKGGWLKTTFKVLGGASIIVGSLGVGIAQKDAISDLFNEDDGIKTEVNNTVGKRIPITDMPPRRDAPTQSPN